YTIVAYAAWGLILLVWIPSYFMTRKAVRRWRPLPPGVATPLRPPAFLFVVPTQMERALGGAPHRGARADRPLGGPCLFWRGGVCHLVAPYARPQLVRWEWLGGGKT